MHCSCLRRLQTLVAEPAVVPAKEVWRWYHTGGRVDRLNGGGGA